jgi:hypothetical protein
MEVSITFCIDILATVVAEVDTTGTDNMIALKGTQSGYDMPQTAKELTPVSLIEAAQALDLPRGREPENSPLLQPGHLLINASLIASSTV